MDQQIYKAYVDILKEELVPAMGCTEPIAVVYAGALARQTLGCTPERTQLIVSGKVISSRMSKALSFHIPAAEKGCAQRSQQGYAAEMLIRSCRFSPM